MLGMPNILSSRNPRRRRKNKGSKDTSKVSKGYHRKVVHTPKIVEIEEEKKDEKMEEEPVAPMSSTGVDASMAPEIELNKASMEVEHTRGRWAYDSPAMAPTGSFAA